MKIKALLAISLIAAILVSLAPAPRALADGAASTRNILLGVGAAAGTLLIINHNKKVHQKYAEDAQKEATLANQRDDAQAAYKAEQRAYDNQLAVSQNLKKEVAVKDNVISAQKQAIAQQQQQLAQLGIQSQVVAAAPAVTHAVKPAPMQGHSAQMLSYGWGTL
jgi:hypothetical protein